MEISEPTIVSFSRDELAVPVSYVVTITSVS